MYDESIKPPAMSYNKLASSLNCIGVRPITTFDGYFSKQDKVTFTHKKVVNIYVVFDINL